MWHKMTEDDEMIEKKKTQVRLTHLRVQRISLVDKPASGAEWAIMKRFDDEANRRAGERLINTLCALPDEDALDFIASLDPSDAADLRELMLEIEQDEAEESERIAQRQDELTLLRALREATDEQARDFIDNLDDADAQDVHNVLSRQLQRQAA